MPVSEEQKKKYLNGEGVATLWSRILAKDAEIVTQLKNGDLVPAQALKATQDSEGYNIASNYIRVSSKGVANGVATLGNDGVVPSTQLPSYVDDVLEFSNRSAFPATGASGKIYIAIDTNKTYRWGATTYVEISQSIAIGPDSDNSPSTAASSQRVANLENRVTNTEGEIDAIQEALGVEQFGTGILGRLKVVETHNETQDGAINTNSTAISTLQTALNNKVDKTGTNIDIRYTEGFDVNANSLRLSTTNGGYLGLSENGQASLGCSPSDSTNYKISIREKGHTYGGGIFAVRPIPSGDFDVTEYEILDESMALSTTDINAICV